MGDRQSNLGDWSLPITGCIPLPLCGGMTSYMFLGLTHTYLNMQYITLITYIFY